MAPRSTAELVVVRQDVPLGTIRIEFASGWHTQVTPTAGDYHGHPSLYHHLHRLLVSHNLWQDNPRLRTPRKLGLSFQLAFWPSDNAPDEIHATAPPDAKLHVRFTGRPDSTACHEQLYDHLKNLLELRGF